MITLYRLKIDGKVHKAYDKIGSLKNAIHTQNRKWRKLTVDVFEVDEADINTVDASEIMGGERCDICFQYPNAEKDDRWHSYGCPRYSRW